MLTSDEFMLDRKGNCHSLITSDGKCTKTAEELTRNTEGIHPTRWMRVIEWNRWTREMRPNSAGNPSSGSSISSSDSRSVRGVGGCVLASVRL